MKTDFSDAHRDLFAVGQTRGEQVFLKSTNVANTVKPGDEYIFQLNSATDLLNLEAATEVDRK